MEQDNICRGKPWPVRVTGKGKDMSFAERLRVSRKEKGLSQEALAEKLKVSRQSVTKWESGISYPEIRTLILLSETLDRELDWLLSDERNRMIKQETDREKNDNGEKISNQGALKKMLERGIISQILHALDRLEFYEKRESGPETEAGTVKYAIMEGIVYMETEEVDFQTGEKRQTLSEIEFHGMRQFLPWLENALSALFLQENYTG